MYAVPASQALELCEALARHAMAQHANIKPRGFDSVKARAAIHEEIDQILDQHAELTLEALLEARAANDDGTRHELDDVIEAFGFTRAELES